MNDYQLHLQNSTWILQWNCRRLHPRKAELCLHLQRTHPIALLLQESNDSSTTLPGYIGYHQLSIKDRRMGWPSTPGKAAIYVDKYIPHTQLDTTKYCTTLQEVIAACCTFHQRTYIIVSAYFRPGRLPTLRYDFSWISHLSNLFPSDFFIIGGDLNAHHQDWGYPSTSHQGHQLLSSMTSAKLVLFNDVEMQNRLAQYNRQNNTTPDSTWGSHKLKHTWTALPDTMGSDHLPIAVTLHSKSNILYRYVQHINRDWCRCALMNTNLEPSSLSLIMEAIRHARK